MVIFLEAAKGANLRKLQRNIETSPRYTDYGEEKQGIEHNILNFLPRNVQTSPCGNVSFSYLQREKGAHSSLYSSSLHL